DGSESLKVKFGGLPEGTIVSSPARIGGVTGLLEVAQSDIDRNEAQTAQFEADLAETLRAIEEINALPNPTQEQLDELAALEQTKSDLEGRLQGLIDQRTELVARRDEIAERLDKLSQEAGVDGHVVIEEFGSFFDLQLPDGTIDDFVLTVEAMATESDPVASEPQRAASASATIDVSVQEIPVAVDDELIVREDIPATINVTANDTDSDGDSLTIVGVTNGANGTAVDVGSGNVQYTPDPNFSGDDEFTYTIEDPDGNQSTATVRVTVFGVADVPGLTVPETLQTIDLADIDLSGIMGTLVDTDGSESLQIKLSDVPPGSAVTNPDAIATLEQERGENDATIKILSGNVKTNQGLISDKEGELLDLLNDPNATQEEIDAKRDEIDVLRQQISDDTEQLAAANARNAEIAAELSTLTLTPDTEGMVRIPGDTAGWVLRLSPDTTENFGLGVEALATESGEVLNEDDRTASSGQTVVGVRVFESSQAQNDNVGTDEDTPVTIAVLANDLGDLGAPVDVVDASNGANGTVEINSDGTITYTPNLDFNGNDQFTYTIEEEGAGQSTATVTVNVAPVNDLPQSGPVITGTPEVGQTLTANPDPIFDPDGIRSIDQYLWEGSSDGGNSWGPIVGPFQSTLEITPDLEGLIIRVRVFYTDEGGTEEDAASAPTAAVEAANQDPIANEDNITFPGGLAVAIDVLDNDSDPDGDPVQIVSVTPPSNGITAILTGQQRIGYNPDEGFVGIDTFTYEISDGNGGT
ncbi:MAG: Ig-like domain-containing protein, partial [Pseudomonadota bacterium]